MAKTPKAKPPEVPDARDPQFDVVENHVLMRPVTLAEIEDAPIATHGYLTDPDHETFAQFGSAALALRVALSHQLGHSERRFQARGANVGEILDQLERDIRTSCPAGRSPELGATEITSDGKNLLAAVTVRFV